MSTDKLSNLKSPWQETLRAIVFTASTLRPSLEVSFEIDRSKFPVKVPIDRTAWHKRKMRERADTEDSDESDACSTDTSIIRAAKRSKPTSTAKQRQSMPSRSARLPQRRAYVLERSHGEHLAVDRSCALVLISGEQMEHQASCSVPTRRPVLVITQGMSFGPRYILIVRTLDGKMV